MSLEVSPLIAEDCSMGRVAQVAALVGVAMSLVACGMASVSADKAYFARHAGDARVQSCLWAASNGHRYSGRTRGASAQTGYIVGGNALHRAVLCMQRRLVRH